MTPEPIKGSHASFLYLKALSALGGIFAPADNPPPPTIYKSVDPALFDAWSGAWEPVTLSQPAFPYWAFCRTIFVPDDLPALLTEHFGNTEPRL